MQSFTHKKMYKSGKLWVVAAMSCILLPLGAGYGTINASASEAQDPKQSLPGGATQTDSAESSGAATDSSASQAVSSSASAASTSVASTSSSSAADGHSSSSAAAPANAVDNAAEVPASSDNTARFKIGDRVQIKNTADTASDGSSLIGFRGWVGTIQAVSQTADANTGWQYQIIFQGSSQPVNLAESNLQATALPLTDSRVNGSTYTVPLRAEASSTDNNQQLQQAFTYAAGHAGTKIELPTGNFLIGASGPKNLSSTAGNIILSSNTELHGNNTTLIVAGQSIWVGMATGNRAVDGVSNFTMSDLDIRAQDLKNGNFFIVMADHGSNWQVSNNTFTMVQTRGGTYF